MHLDRNLGPTVQMGLDDGRHGAFCPHGKRLVGSFGGHRLCCQPVHGLICGVDFVIRGHVGSCCLVLVVYGQEGCTNVQRCAQCGTVWTVL